MSPLIVIEKVIQLYENVIDHIGFPKDKGTVLYTQPV